MMDGQRARRLKCGSPIGRIVDEAGDAMQYTCIGLMLGYITKMPPSLLCLGHCFVNLPQYCMEMSFKLSGNLVMTVGDDLGPVEVEVIIASIFMLAGVFGNTGLDKPI